MRKTLVNLSELDLIHLDILIRLHMQNIKNDLNECYDIGLASNGDELRLERNLSDFQTIQAKIHDAMTVLNIPIY